MPRPRVRPRKEVGVSKGGAYFSSPKLRLKFISTGCKMLDLVLGGGGVLGRILNFVGDKSTGKCTRDSYILTECGLQKIDEVGEKFGVGLSPWKQDLALDSRRKSQATYFYKERVASTLKVSTRHGFELEATPDHKIMVLCSDLSFEMRRLRDVQPGDHVAIAPNTQVFGHTPVTLAWAGLLGFLVADGSLSIPDGGPVISNQKEWAQDWIVKYCRELGLSFYVHDTHITIGRGERKKVAEFFGGSMDGMTAAYKFVPPKVLAADRVSQVEFLRVLMSCDSYITDSELQYVTASRRLAREVHMMLLNLGVVATFRKSQAQLEGWESPRDYYNLLLSGRRYDTFLSVVGTYRDIKKALSVNDKSSYLTIPYIGDAIRCEVVKMRNRLGWSRNGTVSGGGRLLELRGLHLFSRRKYSGMTRDYAHRVVSCVEGFLDAPFVGRCKEILETDFVFEEVVSKELLRKRTTVYDMHVPDSHLFWSSGFISHNTLQAIELSANFAFVYPKGLMRYKEAESAFDPDYAEALGMPVARIEFSDAENTVEAFHDDLRDFCRRVKAKNVTGLYVLDSLDALSDEAEMNRGISDPTYGGSKAKQMSTLFRKLVKEIGSSNVCLVIISQVRDAIGVSFGKKHTRSGGRALDFYASQVVWLAKVKTLRATRKTVTRATGIRIKAKCEKNKISLPLRECEYEIQFGYGSDDLKASLEWLKEVKRYDELDLPDIFKVLSEYEDASVSDRAELKSHVDTVTSRVWYEIEKEFLPKRRKYATD